MSEPLKCGEWKEGLPTEPGIYLFYGDHCSTKGDDGVLRADRPHLFVLKAGKMQDGHLMCTGDGSFVFKKTAVGLHAPILSKLPELTPGEKKL